MVEKDGSRGGCGPSAGRAGKAVVRKDAQPKGIPGNHARWGLLRFDRAGGPSGIGGTLYRTLDQAKVCRDCEWWSGRTEFIRKRRSGKLWVSPTQPLIVSGKVQISSGRLNSENDVFDMPCSARFAVNWRSKTANWSRGAGQSVEQTAPPAQPAAVGFPVAGAGAFWAFAPSSFLRYSGYMVAAPPRVAS